MIVPPPPKRPIKMLDVECYRNYFLVKLYDIATRKYVEIEGYTLSNGIVVLNRTQLINELMTSTIVTFNGDKYDVPMIACALAGHDNATLKSISDSIITGNMQPWDVETTYLCKIPEYLDHIDLFNVSPGMASLKIYMGRMHSKTMQDLPYEHTRILSREEMINVNKYCGNDLAGTGDMFSYLKADIALREDLSTLYKVDLRSKSDAQIAEAAFKKLLPFKPVKPKIPPGFQFYYETPSFINFTTPLLKNTLAMIERSPFTIEPSGQPKMTKELAECEIKIGTSVYRLGSGGLHSSEESVSHFSDETYVIVDIDAESYYPKIISILRMFPHQIGEMFLTIYDGWIKIRLEYKHAGEKKKASIFKIKINGTFGKTGSKYSILYSPSMMIQTTITGQLCLLMLIERLECAGVSIVSANTDGIVTKCRRDMHHIRDLIVEEWCTDTGFKTESNEYLALYSRDINNYLAFKPAYTDSKGVYHEIEVKAKGAYAPSIDSSAALAKNPTGEICIDAMIAYIVKGVPLEKTIRECSDIRRFVTVRAVKGGGEWVRDTMSATTIKGKSAELLARGWTTYEGAWYAPSGSAIGKNLTEAYCLCNRSIERTYLGKAVRWYYGTGQTGHIAYVSNGNLAAKSEGCKPCMTLPDIMPPDIDYEHYINETREMLVDIGINTI